MYLFNNNEVLIIQKKLSFNICMNEQRYLKWYSSL